MADNNDISLSDSQIANQISSDSGIQKTDSSLEESNIIHTVEIHSTPILGNQNKKPDNDTMLARLYDMMYSSVAVSYTHLHYVTEVFILISVPVKFMFQTI